MLYKIWLLVFVFMLILLILFYKILNFIFLKDMMNWNVFDMIFLVSYMLDG